MSNIWIITSREYFTRVKKKSFILMTLLTPLLITAFYGIIIWVSIGQSSTTEHQSIGVLDPTGFFEERVEDSEHVDFVFLKEYDPAQLIDNDSLSGLITVPIGYQIEQDLKLKYESESGLSVNTTQRIERTFRDAIKTEKLNKLGVSNEQLDSLKSSVSLVSFKIEKDGSTTSSNIGINTALGMVFAFLIYFFIFLYGVQVMKGVIEEKTNRIVELIVSTVKPFQLMMGKVIGIALVGLTQLTIWVLLSTIFTGIISLVIGINFLDMDTLSTISSNPAMAGLNTDMAQQLEDIPNIPIGMYFAVFVFYFLGGYLFYGALFAAIGSAVDSETDTQQFMLPITLPLVFSFAISFSMVVGDPHSTLATWMSMIPISSPIVMMVRLPFGPPTWEIIVSMLILIASIIGAIAFAGKIYRTGILMYGKKPTYKEVTKWLFYKN